MDLSIICLDSDDEELPVQTLPQEPEQPPTQVLKRPAAEMINDTEEASPNKIRRVQPTKVGEIQKDSVQNEAFAGSERSESETETVKALDGTEEMQLEPVPSTSKKHLKLTKNELTEELENLIRACRAAEKSDEMKAVIKKKLLKYYHSVHPDYVTSKNFVKMLKSTTEDILKEPTLVYAKLKVVIDELDVRRKSKASVITTEAPVEVKDAEDEGKQLLLKKLNRALVRVKHTIMDLEEAEVEWDEDDNSSYLKKVRFEKRACEIYEKICELTGESKHAHRIVKKPIPFKGTDFPEFNKQLQKMVNSKNMFPNYRDVLKHLNFCNQKYTFGLSKDQLGRVAQDAFEKLGKALQQRRKSDLYESATFYVGKTKDPAKDDPELRVQLEKNKKNYAKCDDIINEFAKREEKGVSDDTEEVSSTSKTEAPAPSNEAVVSPEADLTKISPKEKVFEENGLAEVAQEVPVAAITTTITVDMEVEDDIMIIS